MCTTEKDILAAQLVQVNERSRMYAQRFWQIPFAYIGIVGVSLTAASGGPPQFVRLGAVAMCLMGVLVLWMMVGTFGAIDRSVTAIQDMESKLKLPPSVKKHYATIDIPNFSLAVVGIVVCAIAAWIA